MSSSLLPASIIIYSEIWDFYNPIPKDPKKPRDPNDPQGSIPEIRAIVFNNLAVAFRKNRSLNILDTITYPVLAKRVTICSDLLNKTLAQSNKEIRDNLGINGKQHIQSTRERIMKGAEHLDPTRSIVVVCGSQITTDGKPIEPLKELAKRCKKLVLIDCDPSTLEFLSKTINQPAKVATFVTDLGLGIQQELVKLTAIAQELKLNYFQLFKALLDLYHEHQFFLESSFEINPLETFLGNDFNSIDYVVSSLVSTELSSGHREYNWMAQLLYKKDFVDLMSALYNFDPKSIGVFNKNMIKLTNFLALAHVTTICSWAKQGTVYLADTITVLKSKQKAAIGQHKLTPETIQHIEKLAGKVDKSSWTYNAEQTTQYLVISWLMSGFKLRYITHDGPLATASGTATTAVSATSASPPTATSGTSASTGAQKQKS